VHRPAPVPIPLRETICGLSAALSANESVPFKLPEVPGVKVTLTVQLAPDKRVELQVLVWPKSALAAILAILRVVVP
jgi:hypothetical protein